MAVIMDFKYTLYDRSNNRQRVYLKLLAFEHNLDHNIGGT